MPVLIITAGSFYLHDTGSLQRITADRTLLATWITTLAFIVVQLVLAWSQKPVKVNPRQQAGLDQLRVTVVIPCYNEDPQILDRTIVSLVRQTRLPDHIEVVDDGSTVDYAAVRDYWLSQQVAPVRFTWVRQRNAGKKHAQAVTFTSDHDADIFVTIDSDSALDRRAIHEGLKPFADKRVVSVAGLETAINIDRNLLTRAIGHRSLVFQLFAMSAQSVARGNVLINPGAFSLYRAPLIRKIVPSYLGETFFGVPVTLGDDTALTLYALLYGRAVHQPTAVSLPVYPETLTHHLRQWTRWMRASTIRMLWRLRYLPVLSYGWIFTVYTIGSFLFSVAITIAIPLVWPASEKLLLASIAAMVIWPLSISLRLATVRRSDQGVFSRLFGIALLPMAALWYVLVLRQIRFYGIATCWRQGWVTRQHVEVRLDGSHDPVPGSVPSAEAAERGQRLPEVAFYEGRARDPRRDRDPRGLPDQRVTRDPRLHGPEIGRDQRPIRERDGARYPRAVPNNGRYPRVVTERGDHQYPRPSAREHSVPQHAHAEPYLNNGQKPPQPQAFARDRRPGETAARYQPDPWDRQPARSSRGFAPSQDPRSRSQRPTSESGDSRSRRKDLDPRGYHTQRVPFNSTDGGAGQDRIPQAASDDLAPRTREPQRSRDQRGSMPRPDQSAGRAPFDPVAARVDVAWGRYVPGASDDRQVSGDYREPYELNPQGRRLGPSAMSPADPWRGLEPHRSSDARLAGYGQSRTPSQFVPSPPPAEMSPIAPGPVGVRRDWQDWAVVEQQGQRNLHDHDGGYMKGYSR